MHILLIEDDPLVASGIVAGLRLNGLTTDHVSTASQAQLALTASQFDICILDLGLPDADGMDLLADWRSRGNDIPVLILSARDTVAHRVKGLAAGADDYLLKPFDFTELVARLLALVRRASGRAADRIEHGNLTFIASTGEVLLYGSPVDLSRREITLLRALLLHPKQTLSINQLHDNLYGFDQDVESNAINVHIHNLRRKLGIHIVETVRGLGYRLGTADGSAT